MKSVLKEILSTSLYLLCVLAICFLLIKYVGQRTQVEGSSMETTLCDGDNLIVDKISYRFHDPERFDILLHEDGSSFQRCGFGLIHYIISKSLSIAIGFFQSKVAFSGRV